MSDPRKSSVDVGWRNTSGKDVVSIQVRNIRFELEKEDETGDVCWVTIFGRKGQEIMKVRVD